jgi:hypothetical protein
VFTPELGSYLVWPVRTMGFSSSFRVWFLESEPEFFKNKLNFGLVRIDQGIKKFNFFKLSSGSQIGQFSHIQ